jgi:hypothetical protein
MNIDDKISVLTGFIGILLIGYIWHMVKIWDIEDELKRFKR